MNHRRYRPTPRTLVEAMRGPAYGAAIERHAPRSLVLLSIVAWVVLSFLAAGLALIYLYL